MEDRNGKFKFQEAEKQIAATKGKFESNIDGKKECNLLQPESAPPKDGYWGSPRWAISKNIGEK